MTATYVSHAGNGSADDTTRLNALLAAGGYVKGKPGTTYTISAPLEVPSGTTLEMRGCAIAWKTDVTGNNLVRNKAAVPQRVITDAATTSGSTTVTSATAAFTSADVGRSISTDGATPPPTARSPRTSCPSPAPPQSSSPSPPGARSPERRRASTTATRTFECSAASGTEATRPELTTAPVTTAPSPRSTA